VSVSTVSKVLNGYDEISEATKELVTRTAKELHYVPNNAARLLKTNMSHNIGVLFIDETMCGLTHEYFATILNGTRDEAEKEGYDITFIGRNIGEPEMTFLEHARYRKCDGVVIASVNFGNEQVVELAKSEIPVVTIDYNFGDVTCVLSDNSTGGYEMTKYLLEAGHRDIAVIHGEDTDVTRLRMAGFRKAMEEYGVPVNQDYMIEGIYHEPSVSAEATRKLLALPNRPTVIMYPDDYSYLGGMAEMEREGISVPDDISVVGYDGIPLSQVLRPRLTTWFQDADRIGRISAQKLIEKINTGKGYVAEEVLVKGRLLEGNSVKRV